MRRTVRTRALGVGSLVLLGGLLAYAGASQEDGWDLAPPAPVETGAPVGIEDRTGLECARCHATVADEWAASLHGFAWEDPDYQLELEDRRRKESCYGCHVPQPLHVTGLGEKPIPREDARHLGVTCEACHLGPEGEILGPRGTPTDAHASRRADTFVGAGTNALCSACHATFVGPVIGLAKDFAQAGLEAEGKTCVGCHMAPVERRWANPPADDPQAAPAPVRAGFSHALQTPRDPAFLRRAFVLSARVEDGVTVLQIANAAGHRVPGLIGRSIELEAVLADDAGTELDRGELRIDTESYLPVGESLRIELEGEGHTLHVRGLHVDPRLVKKVPFLDEEIPVER